MKRNKKKYYFNEDPELLFQEASTSANIAGYLAPIFYSPDIEKRKKSINKKLGYTDISSERYPYDKEERQSYRYYINGKPLIIRKKSAYKD